MKTNNISIGWALACLNNDDGMEEHNNFFLDNNNNSVLESIRLRYTELKNSQVAQRDILNKVPRNCCPSAKAFLNDNNDFFIAYHLASEDLTIHIDTEHELIKHLNDCYWCFKSYNQFIKDYHFTLKNYKQGGL